MEDAMVEGAEDGFGELLCGSEKLCHGKVLELVAVARWGEEHDLEMAGDQSGDIQNTCLSLPHGQVHRRLGPGTNRRGTKCSKHPEEFWGVGGRVFRICGVQSIDNNAFTLLPALGNEA
jgi:hypothetical protein